MGVLTDKKIKQVLGRKIVIYPFDEEKCLTPLGYDLRIGYAVALNENVAQFKENEEIKIPPKTSVFIISKEHVWLSGKVVGTLHSIGGLAAQGLFLNCTTIDPNWAGQLTFLITNTSEHSVKLDINSRFVTMILHEASLCTENGPQAGPITVAEKYGNIYGEVFSQTLLKYLTSEKNIEVQKTFKKQVEKAKIDTRWFQPIKELFFAIVSTIPIWLKIILIFFLGIMIVFSTTVIFIWEDFAIFMRMQSTKIDGQTFASLLAAIVASIVAIIGLIKIKSK